MAVHLSIEPLKPRSGLETVPSCEPSIYQLISPGPALRGAGPNWEQFRSAQVSSQLAPRSVELVAGPNWEQIGQLA